MMQLKSEEQPEAKRLIRSKCRGKREGTSPLLRMVCIHTRGVKLEPFDFTGLDRSAQSSSKSDSEWDHAISNAVQ